jgi:hypothetical protein
MININPIKIRWALYLFLCIGPRILFTIFSYFAYGWVLILLGILAMIPVIKWLHILFVEKRDTGLEVLGNTIWWKNLRPLHMFLWGFFAYLAISGNHKAWIVLALDTGLGLFSFLIHHWSEGNMTKLIE